MIQHDVLNATSKHGWLPILKKRLPMWLKMLTKLIVKLNTYFFSYRRQCTGFGVSPVIRSNY